MVCEGAYAPSHTIFREFLAKSEQIRKKIYYAGSWLGILLELIGLSVLIIWLYVLTDRNVLLIILFHAVQNFFVILNDGLTIGRQHWLMAIVYVGFVLVIAILIQPKPTTPVVGKISGVITT